MLIKVLRGCVGDKERLVVGQVVEIKEPIGKLLVTAGMAEETTPKKPRKKKETSDDGGNSE